ncbi:MAG: pentapeptide repeat-containing protein [Alphaproteobacteria bacterium]|nr:pentapeptide repeat-containing protein [Alphaproteobacteria bacterium]MBV9375492.1 pentapeptide repeat-containing protein [Alphaproteobacteria bacterium]
MPNADHVDILRRGAAAWNSWRAEQNVTPDLSGAGLRGFDLSGFDLFRADLRGADLRGTNFSQANLSGSHMEDANLFKAVLDGADLAGAFLSEARFLNCAQLIVTRNWQSAFRDETLGCGASIPEKSPSE